MADNGGVLAIDKTALVSTPEWFQRAIAAPYEAGTIDVEGATLEYRAWGERGLPGLVLLHGNLAHLGWWSFLAPFFATDHRVVAFSFSGMGRSSWRRKYSVEQYARETLAVASAAGADLAGPPVIVGHSLGGNPVIHAAAHMPEKIRAAVTIDTALAGPEMMAIPRPPSGKTYPDLETALSRFRLSPPQPCENAFILGYLGRMALKQLDDGNWSWRFDRSLWNGINADRLWDDLAQVKAPFCVIMGSASTLTTGAMRNRVQQTVPSGTAIIDIPEAHHHVMIDQPLALVASLRTLLATWA